MARYLKILAADIANGVGFRTTIFFAGCDMNPHCPNCFNSSAWSPDVGSKFTSETIQKVIEISKSDWCYGLSVLGGEPSASYNIKEVIQLCKAFREAYPSKDIWLWSGRYFKELLSLDHGEELLNSIDYLVDGRFVEELKDISLRFKGSSNQHIWHKTGEIWEIVG